MHGRGSLRETAERSRKPRMTTRERPHKSSDKPTLLVAEGKGSVGQPATPLPLSASALDSRWRRCPASTCPRGGSLAFEYTPPGVSGTRWAAQGAQRRRRALVGRCQPPG